MMDFSGPGGAFSFANHFWGVVLDLAGMHGWQPAGTLRPEDVDYWDGSYFSNDGQRVTDEDASNLADALEKALSDVPDHDALSHKAKRVGETDIFAIPWETPVASFEWFSGERKQRLRDFIEFCRAGGFKIW